MHAARAFAALIIAAAGTLWSVSGLGAGGSQASPSDRLTDRIAALEREGAELARQARTLVGEVRKLEVERDLRAAQSLEASRAADLARRDVAEAGRRLRELEAQRVASLPELQSQLVDLYKRGRRGEWTLVLSSNGVREAARASRAAEALAYRRRRAVTEHQQTLASLRAERDGLAVKSRELREQETRASVASQAAERAVAARAALLDDIDARRDLTAQYLSELQEARDRAPQLAAERSTGAVVENMAVPFGPFRGALTWPVAGRVAARFGQPGPTPGSVRNGVDIAAQVGAPVKAIHDGVVEYAEGYTGLGTLVILDHGSNTYSLYGYLSEAVVKRGQRVTAGAEVGRVGPPPVGDQAALYFELRVDGRLVDPVQWLEPR